MLFKGRSLRRSRENCIAQFAVLSKSAGKFILEANHFMGKQFPYLNVKLADVEKYPDFSTLLNNLGQYAEEVLRHARHSWLLNHILYLEVQELLLDYEIRSLDTSLSSRDQQFHKLLQQCLTQAEIGDYLEFSPDPSAKVTALGLTREELQRQNPHKQTAIN
ncbi:HAUS4-like protein [Mya arenaria]|uniref:HAUS4-like protein n=1 Tax=Mya arenaria TaxID=6604 RepID=A0ABY7ET03_MYAAR|nr:HAUS4-like protein [Mya arenaria]